MHLQQRLREAEQKLIEKNNELEEKNNEYRRATDAKEKSYKTMLDIARKSSGGGTSVEWFKEVLARGPLQYVSSDESEATLWQVVEEDEGEGVNGGEHMYYIDGGQLL